MYKIVVSCFIVVITVLALLVHKIYMLEKHGTALNETWLHKCVLTVAGAEGVVSSVGLDGVNVAFKSGVNSSYQLESLTLHECQDSNAPS